MGKPARRPDPEAIAAVRRPHDASARRRAIGAGLFWAFITYLLLLLAFLGQAHIHPLFPALGALVSFVVGLSRVHAISLRGRLAAARALLDERRWEAAVVALKSLQRGGHVADEATYFVALCYDRQGARRLAVESYRLYLSTFEKGVWAVEARVRLEELEGAPPIKTREVAVERRCPYCKSDVGADAAVVECAACGTAHHAGCYEEQGGCAVYGCASRTARARVRETG